MGNKIHTATLPDGSVARRETTGQARTFTHLVYVVTTQAEVEGRLADLNSEVAKARAAIVAARQEAELPGAAGAYSAAKAAYDHLHEEVEETGRNGGTYKTARWLTSAHQLSVGGRDAAWCLVDEVDATFAATPQQRLKRQEHTVQSCLKLLQEHRRVGACSAHSWSQSAKNAAKAAQQAQKWRPLARVVVTTEIAVRERATRAKKTVEVVS